MCKTIGGTTQTSNPGLSWNRLFSPSGLALAHETEDAQSLCQTSSDSQNPPDVPRLRAFLWSLLDGVWGVLQGSATDLNGDLHASKRSHSHSLDNSR